jgi:MFS family permease
LAVFAGLGIGMAFPLLISLLAQSIDAKEQGLSVGLRSTVNRMASSTVPLIFGVLAEIVGLHLSFYIIGALLILPVFLIARSILTANKANEGSLSLK